MTRVDQVVARPPAHHVQAAEEGGHRRTVRARSLRCVITLAAIAAGRQHRSRVGQVVVTGRGPACGPLPSTFLPEGNDDGRRRWPLGLAPRVLLQVMTWKVMWLEWESNPRQTDYGSVALTKLSYPVGDRAESNRVPASRRLPPAGDPGDGMSATSGIRHGNAARTSPWWKRDRWRIEGAGHRHYRRAIMFGCDADNVQALPVARSKSFGGAGKAWVSERRVAARGAVLASRVLVPTQTKTPPGLAFRGRRQASEIGVADLRRAGIRPLSAGLPCRTRAPARPCGGMAVVWRWRRSARSREFSSGC